jgi:hypothetical protein
VGGFELFVEEHVDGAVMGGCGGIEEIPVCEVRRTPCTELDIKYE